MGDEKQYTIQIKGTAYRFKPLPPDGIERLMMVMHLGVSNSKVVRALTRVLAESAGPEQWEAITDRYMNGEILVQDFTTTVFEKLIKRQAKDKQAEQTDDDAE